MASVCVCVCGRACVCVRACVLDIKIFCPCENLCGLGSVVGIATDYGLDGPGIESRWDRDFSHLSRPAPGPTQPPVQ